MNICTQNNTTVEMCLGKQLDLSGKEKKGKKKEFTWDTQKSLNCVLAERYIIGAASNFQHLHPLHTKLKKAADKGQRFRLNKEKNCQQNPVFS